MLQSCLLFAMFAFPLAQPAIQAQESPQSIFQQLFPQPTGQNGYEEIVAAGEMLAKSTLLVEGETSGLNSIDLAQKRKVIADPPVQEALSLFRRGLTKSLHTPRAGPQESAFKAFGLYRRLARVLALEQYVACADGRVPLALDDLQDGLRLGYAVQSDALIGGLVGVAIDSLTTAAMVRHLDQLSEKECRRVILLARAWQEAPDPAIEAVGAEREQVLKNMQEQFPADPNFPKERILAGMRARLDHYADNLKKPVWERKPPMPLQGEKLVADYVNALAETLDPVFEGTQTAFAKDQARMQVLGVHAAIRKYRWDHDALPASLDALKLVRLVLDPFTGKSLQYRVTGQTTYELTSEGLKPKAE